MQIDEKIVKKMLSSMFYMAAMEGARLVYQHKWNHDELNKIENEIKRFVWKKYGKEK